VWVAFIPLYGTNRHEVAVSASGEFEVYRYLRGKYLIVLYAGNLVLSTTTVNLDGNRSPRTIEIPVKDGP
jgi:hypothetical protein